MDAASSHEFEEHPLSFFFSTCDPTCTHNACLADCSLSAAMSGNTWWYWEFNEAFLKGGHYSITVSAASGSYPTCAARWRGVGLARTTCEMSNLSKAFPAFLFLKVGQRTGFVKETRLLHSSVLQPRGRFIIFTCQFLKCKVIITKVKITLSEYFGRWKHRCWTQQTNVISASSDSFMNVKSTLVQCF